MDGSLNAPLPEPAPVEETMATFDSVPLFMKSLPEDALEDPTIAALQSLAHEGTPDEIAQNFKEQGNDYFKGKRYREASGFYTQGLEAEPTNPALVEALLCNRAACNLELKNYGSVLKDCSKAIAMNPRSSKAHYRSALALMALERFDEAIDCCARCLRFDTNNMDIRAVRQKAEDQKTATERKDMERRERICREKEQQRRLEAAFRERNLIVMSPPNGSSENPHAPSFDPEDPTNNTLIVPAFFLYPQYATSDVISHFVEDTPFSAHLAAMFPPEAPAPEWDVNHEYVVDALVVYAMSYRKRLLKVGKKMTLRDVFKASKEKDGQPKDGLTLKDGCLTFVVLPKGAVEINWVEEFKKSRNNS